MLNLTFDIKGVYLGHNENTYFENIETYFLGIVICNSSTLL